MKLAFVDNLAAVKAAREQDFDRICTDNPYLACDPATGCPVVNTDATITQAEANAIGLAATTLATDIDRFIRADDLVRQLDLPAEHIRLAGSSSRLIASCVYRGLAASRALGISRPSLIGLGLIDQPLFGPDGLTMSRLHSPISSLAKAGFFGAIPLHEMPVSEDRHLRRDNDVPASHLRRVAHWPVALLAYELLSRFPFFGTFGRSNILVFGENESLREALPYLTARGYGMRRLGKLSVSPGAAGPIVALPDALVELIASRVACLGLFAAAEANAMVATVAGSIRRGLSELSAQWPRIRDQIAGAVPTERAIVASNGLFGPRGGLIYAALKARGAVVVDFEHGVTTGLSANANSKIDFSEAATCDLLLCCCEEARASFARIASRSPPRIEAIGLPDQTRKLLRPRLQRRLARRTLQLDFRETTIFHVSTWPPYGNLRPGLGAPTETMIEHSERRLVLESYNDIPHTVIYKRYATDRFAHQPPIERRVTLPDNVRICPPEDFRYLRAAADVIVTSSPTSTLGWAIGSGVPVVWLSSRMIFPLRDEQANLDAECAFLAVDIDRADWPTALRAIVDRPLEAIRRDWAERSGFRNEFLQRAINGPPGISGRRAAAIIDRLAKEA